jgi:hypothetical protein
VQADRQDPQDPVASFERAAKFAALWDGDDLPDPEDIRVFPVAEERFFATVAHRLDEPETIRLLRYWFTVGTWTQPVLYPLQRKDIRHELPERERLSAAAEPLTEQ